MKRSLLAFLGSLLLAVLSMTPAAASPAGPFSAISDGNAGLAVQLYRELGAQEGNLFFSPYSISSAMGMTYAGARGETAAQMKTTLHFRLEQASLNSGFRSLNKILYENARSSGQRLSIANALVLTGDSVSDAYRNMLTTYYDAAIFRGGLEEINGWVKTKTEGKIDRILEQLSANSVCVILNAIYFKGVWESQFDKKLTFDGPFRLPGGIDVKTSFMHRKAEFKLLEEKDFQVLSLPYKGGTLSMVVLLPKTVDGLARLEDALYAEDLKGWLARLDKQRNQKVSVYLPKFKLETKYDLVAPFQKMGMKDAFSPAADFSGTGWRKGDLWIGQIKHRAFVEVNEEGTEAAAATAVEMVTKSAPPRELVFRADHPFMFLIRDNETGTILFIGRMANPAK
ncbi:MAG TPA: serpin family protein [Syntrophorhabdaceae bacterium]|nr:serpin family protein [Syntrophorhabdaceae bacterium]